MKRTIALILVSWTAFAHSAWTAEISFARDIEPIFKEYCVKCHGTLFPQKKLKLKSLKNLMKGGESGAAVVPGAPEKSLLIIGLNLPRPDPRRMPPAAENKDLSPRQIALITEWVRQGAK